MDRSTPDSSAAAGRHPGLRVIAIYKLVKMAALLLVAAGAFGLVREARFEAFTQWLVQLPMHHGHGLLVQLVDRAVEIGPHKFVAIGLAACVYAAVFAAEGYGLWRERRWAEYLTVIVTASLLPFEIWEVVRHYSWLKLATLGANGVIVVYLVHVLHRPRAKLPAQTPGHRKAP
jgi:uncharacterized membrane protein (DUF2068 family)